jgi:hypothetical protein
MSSPESVSVPGIGTLLSAQVEAAMKEKVLDDPSAWSCLMTLA